MEAHAGECHEKRLISFTFEKIPRISLSFKVAPFLYREYEYGLLAKPEFFRESKILGSLCSFILCNQIVSLRVHNCRQTFSDSSSCLEFGEKSRSIVGADSTGNTPNISEVLACHAFCAFFLCNV